MELNLSLSGPPEVIAHDLLIASFNALAAIPARDDDDLTALAECEAHVTRSVVQLRSVHPYLAVVDPS